MVVDTNSLSSCSEEEFEDDDVSSLVIHAIEAEEKRSRRIPLKAPAAALLGKSGTDICKCPQCGDHFNCTEEVFKMHLENTCTKRPKVAKWWEGFDEHFC